MASISSDVRPRAVLDELVRLGMAEEGEDGQIRLLATGFVPRQGFAEMAQLMQDNLHDHLARAEIYQQLDCPQGERFDLQCALLLSDDPAQHLQLSQRLRLLSASPALH